MTNYEIPAEMRDFAERSVAQARKAFEGFMGAVQKSTEVIDMKANPALSGVKDISSKAVVFAEKNVNSAFDLASKLVHAKDLSEVIALQTEFVKTQMEAIKAQATELGEAAKASVQK